MKSGSEVLNRGVFVSRSLKGIYASRGSCLLLRAQRDCTNNNWTFVCISRSL